jgi:hypothetical protein
MRERTIKQENILQVVACLPLTETAKLIAILRLVHKGSYFTVIKPRTYINIRVTN